MKYSLPYTVNLFNYLDDNKDAMPLVNDIYFSDDSLFPSSRVSNFSEPHWEEITNIKKSFGVGLNYVLNPTVWENKFYTPRGKIEFIRHIEKLKNNGVDILTLNNTLLLNDKDLRSSLNGMILKNSVNNLITSLEQVIFLAEELKLTHIFLGRDINRDYDEIRKISKYSKARGITLHALVNEFCFNKCNYKLFCDSIVSQGYKEDPVSYTKLDSKRKTLGSGDNWDISKYLKCGIIYPKQVPEVSKYIDIFKISGRMRHISTLRLTLDAYLKGSDVLYTDLISHRVDTGSIKLSDLPEDYLEKTMNCKSQCHVCKYCDAVFGG